MGHFVISPKPPTPADPTHLKHVYRSMLRGSIVPTKSRMFWVSEARVSHTHTSTPTAAVAERFLLLRRITAWSTGVCTTSCKQRTAVLLGIGTTEQLCSGLCNTRGFFREKSLSAGSPRNVRDLAVAVCCSLCTLCVPPQPASRCTPHPTLKHVYSRPLC